MSRSPHLSPHFTLEELCFSTTAVRLGLDNSAPPKVVENLKILCVHILEPARAILGPIRVNSGYRSKALNSVVGGAPDSQHMTGCAADLSLPAPASLNTLYTFLANSTPYDQLIYEFSTWVHVSWSLHPRTSLLVSYHSPKGKTLYRPVTPSDALLTETV